MGCAEPDLWEKRPEATIPQNNVVINFTFPILFIPSLLLNLIIHHFLELIDRDSGFVLCLKPCRIVITVHVFDIFNIDITAFSIHTVKGWNDIRIRIAREEV